MSVKKIDHVAIVVPDLEQARNFYEQALGLEVSHIEDVAAEQVRIAFLPVGDSEIELIEPTTEDSGVAKYLAKRGPGMHHMCIEVDDIDASMQRLRDQGIELLNEEPATGSDGRRYAFAHPKSTFGVLIELYQYPEAE